MSADALQLLKDVLTKLEQLEREMALQREDFRLVRSELQEQHAILVGLLGHTPPDGIRVAEVG